MGSKSKSTKATKAARSKKGMRYAAPCHRPSYIFDKTVYELSEEIRQVALPFFLGNKTARRIPMHLLCQYARLSRSTELAHAAVIRLNRAVDIVAAKPLDGDEVEQAQMRAWFLREYADDRLCLGERLQALKTEREGVERKILDWVGNDPQRFSALLSDLDRLVLRYRELSQDGER